MEPVKLETPKELVWLEGAADILDNKFRFPGTQVRFGVDAVLGLIPYAGDVITFMVGGFLVIIMYRKGASGKLVFKMITNLFVDGAFGTIPLIGDIFDFKYRAHRKNVNLMIEHYEEGKHGGSAWAMILVIIAVLIGLLVLSVYVTSKLVYWIFS